MQIELGYIHLIGILALYAAAAASAVHAIMDTRTSQGAVAWAIGLMAFPILILPIYLFFGRRKFVGYIDRRRSAVAELHHKESLGPLPRPDTGHLAEYQLGFVQALEELAGMPFTKGNGVRLLIDGPDTFQAIFDAIDGADRFVLIQFYTIRDDGLGQRLAGVAKRAAARGVKVYLLYDEIGSSKTARGFFEDLRLAGVAVSKFNTGKRMFANWQVNFRNHRKIVVVDCKRAFVGGHNVGDEYLGLDSHFGHWRDTHVEVSGPIVAACQISFYEDWYWATGEQLEVEWAFETAADDDVTALVMRSGPADRFETCGLTFCQLVDAATERIWLVSPYFVPDAAIGSALHLAALRGVDVRIIIPDKVDHLVVWLAAFTYLEDAARAGIKIYRYTGGFLHQKVILVDDELAAVGTANLDNRSFRLNFEITVLFADQDFASEVARMLEEDLKHCRRYHDRELAERGWLFRFASRAARLVAPIL